MSKKIAPVSVRLTIEDKGRIAQWAAAHGITVSELLRRGARMVGGKEPDKSNSDKPKRRR